MQVQRRQHLRHEAVLLVQDLPQVVREAQARLAEGSGAAGASGSGTIANRALGQAVQVPGIETEAGEVKEEARVIGRLLSLS